MVSFTDAISDPRAMVVVHFNTRIADGTVKRAGWFVGLARFAEEYGNLVLFHFCIVDRKGFFFGLFGRFFIMVGLLCELIKGRFPWNHPRISHRSNQQKV